MERKLDKDDEQLISSIVSPLSIDLPNVLSSMR